MHQPGLSDNEDSSAALSKGLPIAQGISEPSSRQRYRYVIVSPVRDEQDYLPLTIQSVVGQTIRPAEWVIVNDGSRDNTGAIIDDCAREHAWVKAIHRADRGSRVPGTGVIEAFYDGYRCLQSEDWEFIVKLDGDVGLQSDYFETCFRRFAEDLTLGMCGGMMYCPHDGGLKLERNPVFHVRGPIKLYRRACWDAIGGLLKAPGWDTVDEVQANRLGWSTKSFSDLKVIHYRPTGAVQGVWRDGVKLGRANYITGYHPLFMVAKCVKRILQPPYLVAGVAHAYGFITGYLKGIPQVSDVALVRYVRRQQLRRLLLLDSIWK